MCVRGGANLYLSKHRISYISNSVFIFKCIANVFLQNDCVFCFNLTLPSDTTLFTLTKSLDAFPHCVLAQALYKKKKNICPRRKNIGSKWTAGMSVICLVCVGHEDFTQWTICWSLVWVMHFVSSPSTPPTSLLILLLLINVGFHLLKYKSINKKKIFFL